MPMKTERLDMRLKPEHKLLIARAAEIEGQSITQYAAHTLVSHSEQVVQEHELLQLSARDSKLFVEIMTANEKPNAALLEVVEEYNAERRSTAAQMAH